MFGFGKHGSAVDIDVVWPTGTLQTLKGTTIDRSVVFIEPTAGNPDGSVHIE